MIFAFNLKFDWLIWELLGVAATFGLVCWLKVDGSALRILASKVVKELK
jgi:hypothetical protein